MRIRKLARRENLTKKAFWSGLVVTIETITVLSKYRTVLGTPLLNSKDPDPDQTVGSGYVSN
jgi:hypothetical protein